MNTKHDALAKLNALPKESRDKVIRLAAQRLTLEIMKQQISPKATPEHKEQDKPTTKPVTTDTSKKSNENWPGYAVPKEQSLQARCEKLGIGKGWKISKITLPPL